MKGFYALVILFLHGLALALLEENLVAFEYIDGSIEFGNAPILRDASDPVGVKIAADSLAGDLEEVTDVKRRVLVWDETASVVEDEPSTGLIIIAATVDSPLVSRLEENGKINVDDIRGKWESFRTVLIDSPLPGIKHALAIVGSDKRGTMFGVFTLSEQIGKSPLHWWADVPVTKHKTMYALNKTTTQGEPSVKYRGIFINDEAPALTGWWAKHANVDDYTFNAEFYEHVFDLLVRLKANFLWPAMWGSFIPTPGRSFFTDDLRNQQLADDYGIVLSTSHTEPMQCSPNEWKIEPTKGAWDWVNNKENVVKFMEEGVRRAGDNETYFTLGMRGENDSPIEADDPIAVLRDVFSTQRQLLAKYHGNNTSLQAWTVYKEVMTYYTAGLVPPDDVTLIFPDDNWGNVQRLPTEEERQRPGGIGLYYHFDYVGRPKSWKWQNNNNLPKVYKELSQAYERGADRVWVINVGDIKPMEIPLSFALDLAWNASRFDFDTIPLYLKALATRDFGDKYSDQISSALMEYSHLAGLRKFEMLEPTTYSILNFREAEQVLDQWRKLAEKAQNIQHSLPIERHDACYHLLTYPVTAGFNYYQIMLGQGKNRQYSFERRNSANMVAGEVLEYFEEDYDLTLEYDNLADGKWEGIMSTPKFDMGIADWRPSSRDVVANLSYVQLRQNFDYAFGNLGIYVEQSLSAYRQGRICGSINPSLPTEEGFSPVLPLMDPYGPNSRLIELFHRILSKEHPEEYLEVSIDWTAVPTNFTETIQLRVEWEPSPPYFDLIHIPIRNHRVPTNFTGFPESGSFVSIEGQHFQRFSSDTVSFKHIPYLGSRARSGSIALRPYMQARESEENAKSAWVEYDFYLFNSTKSFNATVYVNGALDTDPNLPMKFSLSIDGQEANFTRLLGEPQEAGDTPPGWTEAVADHVWTRNIEIAALEQGLHTLKWRVNSPEVYLEKIVLALEGHLDSYLGPPESALVG
ncbi:hypothetical protein BDV27DRAFT_144764 [Aspergillus caelatus]|uniref:Gylcosyl hydrolase 115 C-terminal domain-containing protein n=1 Tax=Aspergillus caelatus TaxID=61420 RepID=A0A5N7A5D9_9EURO|nr:uncharacterized protein BDV27DRAFT_144764 [Aspergillus caelatus]KAE8365064.1 hypothetical protein BDV27DRAFT_144764 [Aspergillus caelatus]